MAEDTGMQIRKIEAKCRVIAADLEARGLSPEHDTMIAIADSIRGQVRTAQWEMSPMTAPGGGGMGVGELADLGSDGNPRPTEEEIMARQPAPGSRLDPSRAQQPTETSVRKWFVRLSDIMAEDENDLKTKIQPIAAELGAMIADYGEEKPRTRLKQGG